MDNALKELQIIPGVGRKIAQEFFNIGINKASDFKGKNPEDIYNRICEKHGYPIDRCVLYICRSSVYFAENKNPDTEKLKWWNWKDGK
ncbi:MAG: helix-hairpin-helix domain-containing protein [bacterium]